MSDSTQKKSRVPGEGRAREIALVDVFSELVSLAHQSTSGSAFYRRGLRLIADCFRSPYAAISVRHAGAIIDDHWHTGPDDPAFWKPAVDSLLTDVLTASHTRMRLFRARNGSMKVNLLSAPILDQAGATIGAVALCVPAADEQAAKRKLYALTSIVALLSYLATAVVSLRQSQQERSCLDNFLSWGALADAESLRHLSFSITNDLRNRLGCEQVAISVIRGGRARILSISGLDHVTNSNPGVRLIRAAMEEAYDHRNPIIRQNDDACWEGFKPIHRLHQQWAQAVGGAAVASVPFRFAQRDAVVISLRAKPGVAFSAEDIEDITDNLTPVVAALPLVTSATRSLRAHAVDTARQGVSSLTKPKGWSRRLALVACIALAGWFLFGTMPYRVSVRCNVVPTTLQHVVAPYDATIKVAYVAAGDEVTKGQTLYELDTEPLILERRRLLAELEVSRIEVDRALANGEPGEASLADAQRQVSEAELALVEDKLANRAARASFDGVVLSGELRELIGQSVSRGDQLYVITPNRDWIVELEIPEWAINDVHLSLSGQFATEATPERRQRCEIVRVLPHAQVREGRNIFVAEAVVERTDESVRPGMRGMVRVDAGRRPVWWIASHRLVDYFRRKLWI